MKYDWVETAIREEADRMARRGLTLPNEADCKSWRALARCMPTLPRASPHGQSSRVVRLWSESCTNLNDKWLSWNSESDRFKLPKDAWSDKEIALRIIFCHAVDSVGTRAFTVSELQARAEEFRSQANQLREEAVTLDDVPDPEGATHAAALRKAALFCEEQANVVLSLESVDIPGLVTQRCQSNPLVRGYCAKLADENRTIYGRELRGIVAGIMNWAFKRTDLTAQQVRDWLSAKRGVS